MIIWSTTWTSMNTGTFSRTTRCLWNTNAPVHTKSKLPGYFQNQSRSRHKLSGWFFCEKIYKKWVLIGLYYIICYSMGTIGKYIDTKIAFKKIKLKSKRISSMSRIFFRTANFLWDPSSSWIEVSEPIRKKCDRHWWHIRPNNINVCWKPRVLHRYNIS